MWSVRTTLTWGVWFFLVVAFYTLKKQSALTTYYLLNYLPNEELSLWVWSKLKSLHYKKQNTISKEKEWECGQEGRESGKYQMPLNLCCEIHEIDLFYINIIMKKEEGMFYMNPLKIYTLHWFLITCLQK